MLPAVLKPVCLLATRSCLHEIITKNGHLMLQVSSSVGSSFMWRTRGPWRKQHLSELRPTWMKRCNGSTRDGTVLVAASPPTWYLERSILWKETSMRRELWWKRMLRSRSWTASYAGWCEILLQLKFLPKRRNFVAPTRHVYYLQVVDRFRNIDHVIRLKQCIRHRHVDESCTHELLEGCHVTSLPTMPDLRNFSQITDVIPLHNA